MLDFGKGGEEPHGIKGSVNQALAFAHFRTSTRPHDIIFALKNTLAHLFRDIDCSYNTTVQATFNDFYRQIATRDLSILGFGSSLYPDGEEQKQSTMNKYDLPSWTGVSGAHIKKRITTTIHTRLECHVNKAMQMYTLTRRYWKISVTPYQESNCYFLLSKARNNQAILDSLASISCTRYKGKWTDVNTADKSTVLIEWLANLHIVTELFATHYHHRHGDPLTLLRPLSLTEDCKECIVLPILLKVYLPVHVHSDERGFNHTIKHYSHNYYLPVLSECSNSIGRYKAVGIYYVGHENLTESPTFNWNHSVGRDDVYTNDPEEIIDIFFENDCHEDIPKEFIIE